MKRVLCLLCALLVIPSVANALVKIKDVTQSGIGNDGTIKIELNGNYDKSKIKAVYESDHLSLIMSDAFVMPVKRVFKSSSDKSSVSKMEASMIPVTKKSGGTVKLNIYFKIPMDLVNKTGFISGSGKIVTFNYKKVSEQKEVAATKTTSAPVQTASIKEVATIPDAGIKDNGDSSIKKDVVAEEKTKNIESKIVNNEEEKKEPVKDNIKRFSTFKVILFKSVKIVGLLVGVILIIVLAWFFFKKSSENRSERRTYSPSSKQPVLSNSSTNYDNGIKLISSSPIEGDKKLLVVEVYGERLLLGTSKSNITMITKLKSKEQTTEDVNYEQEAMMRSRLKDKLRNI